MTEHLRTKRGTTRSIAADLTVVDSCMAAACALAPYFIAGAVALLAQIPAAHADEATATIFVQENLDRAFAIMRDGSLLPQERELRFHALLRSIIDVRRIALFTVGPYAKGASDRQIDDFVQAFSDYFMNAFHFEPDPNLAGNAVVITGATARAADDVIVTARIADASPGKPTAVPVSLSFRVRKNVTGNDTIVDVLVGAISMAVTQRDDFTSYLQRHDGNIDQLSAELKKRITAG